jgi:hypothetical protein
MNHKNCPDNSQGFVPVSNNHPTLCLYPLGQCQEQLARVLSNSRRRGSLHDEKEMKS